MTLNKVNPVTIENITTDRNKLIKSYGFVEQIASNENFLKESLELAAKITGSEIAYISLIDDQKQYILSQSKSSLSTIKAENSICQYTIREDYLLEIENTKIDYRTKNLPIVKENNITFYAGSPLINHENYKIGALCVMDNESKKLTKNQAETLTLIGKQVVNTLDQQKSLIKLIKKINTNFKPAACADLNCLTGELDHLQTEVVNQNAIIKNQKTALEKLNKELKAFAHIVAHDVKTPLKTIQSFAQILEKELKTNSSTIVKKYFHYINSTISNLNELVTDLLTFSKVDKNKNDQCSSILLSEILDSVLLNLTDSIKSTGAQIEVPKDNVMIKGNRSLLISLFQNLISNSIKYQNKGTTPIIKIYITTLENQYSISISDNGIGISEEYFKEIFKPFKRLHGNGTYNGSGIGLATCKKILDQMGSDLIVSSTLNEGSKFTFQLSKG